MSEFVNPSPESRGTAMLAWIDDFAPYGVITTDRELRVQSWNRWMVTHSGRRAEEVLNRNLLELFPDLNERSLTPRFERALAGEISVLSTALHGYLFPMDAPVRHPVFQRMQQTARIAPLLYEKQIIGTIVVIEDVTQRELQALLLQRQHERDRILSWALAHLLESREPRRTIRELFCKIAEHSDFDGYLLYLLTPDHAALKLQAAGGIDPETEQRLLQLHPSHPLAQLFAGSTEVRVFERIDEAGSEAARMAEEFGFHLCILLPLHTPDGFIGLLAFGARNRAVLQEGELELLSTIGKYLAVALHKEATDLELNQAQAKLNEHAQNLEHEVNERTARLREIIAQLETFSYTLAHDLRAPIRALIGYSEVLLEDYAKTLPGAAKTILERLHRACNQLDLLTKDLLEFSKISREEIELRPVDLDELITDVIRFFPNANGALAVRKPLHRVLAHRSLLQQCISNLIDNSLKFVKEGEAPKIVIWTEPGSESEAEIATQPARPFTSVLLQPSDLLITAPSTGATPGPPSGQRVRIVIEDEGIGIPEGGLAKIFGVFERGTSSPQYQGTGIGLAIVARAIQRMGGACGVRSKPGVGSRFWLELPQA